MDFREVTDRARPLLGSVCKGCYICNGRACGSKMPGPGAKGVGDTAMRNYDAWQRVRVNMDTICENKPVDTSLSLFGKAFRYPFFAGPVGAVAMHYGDTHTDMSYNDILVRGCAEAGIAAFTGDGTNPAVMQAACSAIAAQQGVGIPTVKPWNAETVAQKLALCREAGAFAVAMDIDAAGLPFLKNMTPPAGSKTVDELAAIAKEAGVPFIVKGVMTVRGAQKALAAGASGIVVSNHGGRVLDGCAATAEVLEEISAAVQGSGLKVLVDGGIRSGTDIFRALALGANAVIIARPFVTAVYGAAEQGIACLVNKLGAELADTMAMCGAHSLDEIRRDMVRVL